MQVDLLLRWRRVGHSQPSNRGRPWSQEERPQGALLYGKLEFVNTALRDDGLSRDALC
jgi:hypothetical protein